MRVLATVLLALGLAGCTATYTDYPSGSSYDYGSPGYRSGPNYGPTYHRGYYWHGAP